MTIRSTARSYLEIVFHRKMLVLVPIVFATLLALGYSYMVTPMYRSTAVIQVVEQSKQNPFIKGFSQSTPLSARLGSIIQMVSSSNTIEELIKELNLAENAWAPRDYETLVSELRKQISVSSKRNNFIEVSCEYPLAVECRDIVNSITRKVIKQNLASQEAETEAGIEWLNKEIELYRRKLEELEEKRKKFQEENSELLPEEMSNQIYSTLSWEDRMTGETYYPPFQADAIRPMGKMAYGSSYALRYVNISAALLNQGRELRKLQEKRQALLKQLESEDEFVLSQRVTEINPVIRSLRAELTQKQIELARLKVDSTEEHPMVQRLVREIENLRESISSSAEQSVREETTTLNPIYQSIRLELSQVESEIAALEESIKVTSALAQAAFENVQKIPEKLQEATRLKRELGNITSSYIHLVSRREQAYVSRRLELQERGTSFNIIDSAQVPNRPFKPNRPLIVLAGFFLGLMVGAALVVLAEVTDHSFEEANQLREFLPIPMLGAVSQIITPEEKEFAASKKRLGLLGLAVFLVVIVLIILVTMLFGGGGQG